jgi:hypothetical protein
MSKFSYFEKAKVSVNDTKKFPLNDIENPDGSSPTLILAPAAEPNKPYFNALLKKGGRSTRQVVSGKLTLELLQENRNEDKRLFPKYVIKGWENVFNSAGEPVEFSQAECEDFVNSMPDWLFDTIRNYAAIVQNFTTGVVVDSQETGND